MNKNIVSSFGWIFLILGLVLIINAGSFGLTGYSISDDLVGGKGYFPGTLLIIIGIAFILSARKYEDRISNNSASNNHARYSMGELFRREHHGRRPGREELRDYMRRNHEHIGEMIENRN